MASIAALSTKLASNKAKIATLDVPLEHNRRRQPLRRQAHGALHDGVDLLRHHGADGHGQADEDAATVGRQQSEDGGRG